MGIRTGFVLGVLGTWLCASPAAAYPPPPQASAGQTAAQQPAAQAPIR